METLDINVRGFHLSFSRTNDFYPDEYYEAVGNDLWEPATVVFFERNCDRKTVLIDLGAATGVLSMFAAKLGAEVVAFEPNPVAMSVLEKNIEINGLQMSITTNSDAVSDVDSVMKFAVESDPNVLSPIVMHGMQNHENTVIRVRNIVDIVNDKRSTSSKKLVVKMDIEGAEYQILRNKNTVKEISKSVDKMFVSFHPGFNRPMRNRIKYLNSILNKLNYVFVTRDHYKIFKNLSMVGVILNLDGNVVYKYRDFEKQLSLGNLDWIWVPNR